MSEMMPSRTLEDPAAQLVRQGGVHELFLLALRRGVQGVGDGLERALEVGNAHAQFVHVVVRERAASLDVGQGGAGGQPHDGRVLRGGGLLVEDLIVYTDSALAAW